MAADSTSTLTLAAGKALVTGVNDWPDGYKITIQTFNGGEPDVCRLMVPKDKATLVSVAKDLLGLSVDLAAIAARLPETPDGLGHRHPWREVGRPCDDPECDALQCKALRDAETLSEAASERLTDDVMGRGYITSPLNGVSA